MSKIKNDGWCRELHVTWLQSSPARCIPSFSNIFQHATLKSWNWVWGDEANVNEWDTLLVIALPLHLCTPVCHSVLRGPPWCWVGPFGSSDRSSRRNYDRCHTRLQINIHDVSHDSCTHISANFQVVILTVIIFTCVETIPDFILSPTPQCSPVNCSNKHSPLHGAFTWCTSYVIAYHISFSHPPDSHRLWGRSALQVEYTLIQVGKGRDDRLATSVE